MGELTLEILKTHTFDIDIPNFEKWNPDSGRARHWFKMDVYFLQDPRVQKLTGNGVALWVALLGLRARFSGPIKGLDLTYCRGLVKLTGTSVGPLLLKLAELQLCRIVPISLRIEKNREEEKRERSKTEPGARVLPLFPENATENPPPPNRPSSIPDVLEIWNQNRGELPEAKAMNKQREKRWRDRWKAKPDLEYWTSLVKRLASSSFACGGGSTGWRADLDFLLREDSPAKILEGKYDDREPPKPPKKPGLGLTREDFGV